MTPEQIRSMSPEAVAALISGLEQKAHKAGASDYTYDPALLAALPTTFEVLLPAEWAVGTSIPNAAPGTALVAVKKSGKAGFSSGSEGYYATGKLIAPNGCRFQIGMNITAIGSKPGKDSVSHAPVLQVGTPEE